MPTPRPEMAVTSSAVDRLGMNTRAIFCAGVSLLGLLGGEQPGRARLADERVAVDAAAVVGDLDQDLVARLARRDLERAGSLLAGGGALLGAFDAVIDRVADDMGERIADHLDHLAIQLDVAAVGLEADLLAELGGKVADQPRQAREQAVDPLHAGAGDAVANLGDAGGDALEGGLDGDVARRVAQPAGELVARQHRVGDAVHHPVEQVDREADRAQRALRFRLRRGGRLDGFRARPARSTARRSAGSSSSLASDSPVSSAWTSSPIRSITASTALTRAVSATRVPARTSASAPSAAWLNCSSRGSSKKPRIALDGVDEAENLVEPLAVVRRGLPRDDRARQGLRHVARLGDEVVDQLVHVGGAYGSALVNKPFTAPSGDYGS